MIRSHFGLQRNPFDPEAVTLLSHQQEIFDRVVFVWCWANPASARASSNNHC